MVIAGQSLLSLVQSGVIDAKMENVGASSIDVHLGRRFLMEGQGTHHIGTVDLVEGYQPNWERVEGIVGEPVNLQPGEFCLGHAVETLNLPDNVSAQFVLRSSLARIGLNHSLAGWIDAGFSGQLTLELKNMLRNHRLCIRPGMRIGQIVFYAHEDSGSRSYSVRGRYNGQEGPTEAK